MGASAQAWQPQGVGSWEQCAVAAGAAVVGTLRLGCCMLASSTLELLTAAIGDAGQAGLVHANRQWNAGMEGSG